jgi:energy-coupling factor transport system ATP-binding protein
MRIYAAVPIDQQCPVTVREGRLWLDEFARSHELRGLKGDASETAAVSVDDPPLSSKTFGSNMKGQCGRSQGFDSYYPKRRVLGDPRGNGTGKTTALSVITGINKPYRAKSCSGQ